MEQIRKKVQVKVSTDRQIKLYNVWSRHVEIHEKPVAKTRLAIEIKDKDNITSRQ